MNNKENELIFEDYKATLHKEDVGEPFNELVLRVGSDHGIPTEWLSDLINSTYSIAKGVSFYDILDYKSHEPNVTQKMDFIDIGVLTKSFIEASKKVLNSFKDSEDYETARKVCVAIVNELKMDKAQNDKHKRIRISV